MARTAQGYVDLIAGRAILSAETIASELRRRIATRLAQQHGWKTLNTTQLVDLARSVLQQFEPTLAQALYDSEIAAWVTGVAAVASKLPTWALEELALASGLVGRGPGTPWLPGSILWPGRQPAFIRFPLIEQAAKNLADRGIVTRADFDRLAASAKDTAFTVAAQNNLGTIDKMRDILADLVATGPTIRAFRKALDAELIASPLGPAHIETVFRTNVQTAYSAGHAELSTNPIVAEVFPYQAYLAIDDSRVRPEHLALMFLGLNGTNIYRVDDPFWEFFRPPWGFNCRCGVNLMTKRAAAAHGVLEAQEWLRTGQPPIFPDHRLDSIPFRPSPEWSTHPRLRAA